jgi:phage terminase large subunit-like protein
MLTMILLFGGRFAEGYCIANDLEQAQSRVFQAIKRIVEASPLLMREARVTAERIVFPAFNNATISAMTTDYASAAGANPTISCFDELWGYTSERLHRLWDEMIPPNAEDRLPLDGDICRVQRRVRPARRALQTWNGATAARSQLARR